MIDQGIFTHGDTHRGFEIVIFDDSAGVECSLQESSAIGDQEGALRESGKLFRLAWPRRQQNAPRPPDGSRPNRAATIMAQRRNFWRNPMKLSEAEGRQLLARHPGAVVGKSVAEAMRKPSLSSVWRGYVLFAIIPGCADVKAAAEPE